MVRMTIGYYIINITHNDEFTIKPSNEENDIKLGLKINNSSINQTIITYGNANNPLSIFSLDNNYENSSSLKSNFIPLWMLAPNQKVETAILYQKRKTLLFIAITNLIKFL